MGVTFRIYTHVMALQDGDRDRLRALVEGAEWAATGSRRAPVPVEAVGGDASEKTKAPRLQGFGLMANPGLEPGTPRFSVVCSTN